MQRTVKICSMVAALLVAAMGYSQVPFTVDTTFQVDILNTSQTYGVVDIELLPTGLLASGQLDCGWDPWPAGAPRGVVRFNSDGSRDLTFNEVAPVGQIFPWMDGYYLATGSKPVRINADGILDSDHFNDAYLSPFFGATHCYPMADSTLIMGGKYRIRSRIDSSYLPGSFCITKLDKEGEPDTTFQHRSCGGAGHVGLIEPMSDGRLFVSGAGVGGMYDGQAVGHLFRIWPDGSLDTTFQLNNFSWGSVEQIHQLPDGKLLCVGFSRFYEYPNDTLSIFRLLPDGTLDSLYTPQTEIGVLSMIELEPNLWIVSVYDGMYQGQPVNQFVALDSLGNQVSHPIEAIQLGDYIHGNANVGFADIKQSPNGSLYLYGGFSGVDDGYSYYPEHRFITRLHGPTVGIDDATGSSTKDDKSLALFPNPGNDLVNIAIPFTTHNGVFQVYDQQGKLVHEEQVIRNAQGMLRYDAQALPPGLYTFIMLTNTGEKWNGKWVKK